MCKQLTVNLWSLIFVKCAISRAVLYVFVHLGAMEQAVYAILTYFHFKNVSL